MINQEYTWMPNKQEIQQVINKGLFTDKITYLAVLEQHCTTK